jgi:rhodanese-related sulfurtransferase
MKSTIAREISCGDLVAKIAAGEPIHLLDVRQPDEHAFVALPASQLIPLNDLPRRLGEIQPSDGATVVVYCHHGVRSLMAVNFLLRNGFRNVISLAGGIDAWSREVDSAVPRY